MSEIEEVSRHRFSAGMNVRVSSLALGIYGADKNDTESCKIIWRYDADCDDTDSYTYLVKILRTESYAIVHDRDIQTRPFCIDIYQPHEIRVLFIGNGLLALYILRHLHQTGYNIVGIVTMEDKLSGKDKVIKSSVKRYAEDMLPDVPLFQPHKLDAQRFLKRIKALHADVGLVADFRKLPVALYTIPPLGTINIHLSLLPAYKGASPIETALKNGETLTGLTAIRVSEKIDEGKIIDNIAVEIFYEDDRQSLSHRLYSRSQKFADRVLRMVYSNAAILVPQSELVCNYLTPSNTKKLYTDNNMIPWFKSCEQVYNHIRALAPKPGAWTQIRFLDGEIMRVKIIEAEPTDMDWHFPSGEMVWANGTLYIACGDRLLHILRLQVAGRSPVSVKEFINGMQGFRVGFCQLSKYDPRFI